MTTITITAEAFKNEEAALDAEYREYSRKMHQAAAGSPERAHYARQLQAVAYKQGLLDDYTVIQG